MMASLVRDRAISPIELVDAHLDQIARLNPKINAFVRVLADQARDQAKAAESAAKHQPLGLLHGVPVTVKDSFDLAGYPTLAGSKTRLGHIAGQDSAAVARLVAAGAIVLGKTNTSELLFHYESGNNVTGRSNNPWDLDRTPGGSSGGEAAAIAALCSGGGIGSDAGGSIRIPAHFCGIAGLKPTAGRVSAAGHFPVCGHPGGLLGVAGPMARTAKDLSLLFAVLAGYDSQDPFSSPVPLRTAGVNSVRIGLMEQFGAVPVHPGVRAAVQAAAKACEALGFNVEPFHSAGLERAPNLWWFFFGQLPARSIQASINGHDAHYTVTEFLQQALREPEPSASDVLANLAARDSLRASLQRQMEPDMVLLTPACGVPAWRHHERRWDVGSRTIGLFEAMMPSTLVNIAGLPAVTIPFGQTADGLPVGIQLIGRAYEEETLLDLAVRLEEARGPFPSPVIP